MIGNVGTTGTVQRNVALSVNSTGVIQTAGSGLTGGAIGIYVTEDQFGAHGTYNTAFGTFGDNDQQRDNAKYFTNDKIPALYGVAKSDDQIYWTNVVCKLTDGEPHLLYKKVRVGEEDLLTPAIYPTLSEGFEAAGGVLYDQAGTQYSQTGALYLKMLCDYVMTTQAVKPESRAITFTTAETSREAQTLAEGDAFLFVTQRTTDSDKALVTRGFDTLGSMVRSTGTLTVENLTLDGADKYDPQQDTDESQQSGGILNIQGGALTLGSGATLKHGKAKLGGAIYATGSASVQIGEGSLVTESSAASGGALYAESSARVTLSGGEFTSNTATGESGRGGALFVTGSASATLSSGSLTSNTAVTGGGAIYADASVVVNLGGATLTGSTAESGGGIYLGGESILNMTQGTITECSATGSQAGYGGGIYAAQGTTLNLTGGKLLSCTALKGGGIYTDAAANTLKGVTLESCSASADGGAVYAANAGEGSALTLSGTTVITQGQAGGSGGAVYAKGKVTLEGTASIQGASAAMGGGLYASGAVTMSAFSSISGNIATGNGGGVLLSGAARLTMSGSSLVTGNKVTGEESCGGVYLESTSEISMSGQAAITGNQVGAIERGGGVYLAGGVISTDGNESIRCAKIHVKDTVTISGNKAGTGEDAPNSNLAIYGDESLVVDGDLSEGADIRICTLKEADIDQIGVENGVKANLNRITYDRDTTIHAIPFGNRKVVWGFTPVCKLTDASNKLLYRNTEMDPAVYLTLADGFAAAGEGTTLYDKNGQAFDTSKSIQVKLLWDVELGEGISYTTTRTLTLTTAETEAEGAPEGDIYTFSTGRDNTDKAQILRSAAYGSVFTFSNASVTVTDILLNGNKEAHVADTNGGIINVVSGSLTLSGEAQQKDSKTTGNGGAVYVQKEATLTMSGSTLTGHEAVNGGAIYLDGSSFTMTGGTIGGENTATNGGGVYVAAGASMSVPEGSTGSITGGTATAKGGGIFLSSGVAASESQEAVSGAVLTMNSGKINDCVAESGGAIYSESNAANAITLAGTAVINGNTWSSAKTNAQLGGGIYLAAGTLNLSASATIKNCTASAEGETLASGGAVYVAAGASVLMNGGSLSGNTTKTSGGGIFLSSGIAGSEGQTATSGGILTMSGGVIAGGAATSGGGVEISSGAVANLSGSAEISGNRADAVDNGGGVHIAGGSGSVLSGKIHVQGTVKITGNTAGSGQNAPKSNLAIFGDESLVVDADLTTDAFIGICTEKEADIDQIGVEEGVKENLNRIIYDRDDNIHAIPFGNQKVVWNFTPVCKLTNILLDGKNISASAGTNGGILNISSGGLTLSG